MIVYTRNKGAFYPNVVVPICGIVDYYNENGIADIETQSEGYRRDKSIIRSCSPVDNESDLHRPLSKIWRFSTLSELYLIQRALINELRKEEVFADGVLEGIEWSVNEVMDNVLNHSTATSGFIMGQLHRSTKHVAFTIYDAGIGIYNSFKDSGNNIGSNIDALSKCLQEGVTRDSRVGQGNGLAGLFSLIKEGNGMLSISSGSDTLSYREGQMFTLLKQNKTISKRNAGTIVDFQIDYSTDVSIDKILTFQGHTFEFVNLFIDDIEGEDGILHFKISEIAEGTGTRESAMRVKNQLLNSIKATKKGALIDFEGVNVVSSSFIDELLAKLVIEMGLFQFNQRISLKNMSPLLQKTLQKSVIQRIVEDYSR